MTKTLKIGIAGLGTVGAHVVSILGAKKDLIFQQCQSYLDVIAVSARTRNKDRGCDVSAMTWFDDPVAMAKSPDIDVFVELMGGDSGPALDSVSAALKAGKSVVTANKALMARHGLKLLKLAESHNVSLYFEAAVGGGIPIIRAMRDGLVGNRVTHLSGILNGTCNYILTRMEKEHIAFEDILKDAQSKGYAEADPTFDIDGFDTAHKLALLTSLAFGTKIDLDNMDVEGIRTIQLTDILAADELGYRIKLLGVAVESDHGIEQRVHPTMVPKEAPIAQISGVTNAVSVHGDTLGEIVLSGPGAGGAATASAVVADLGDLARGITIPSLARPLSNLKPFKKAPLKVHEGGYYVRLSVFDRTGAFAAIAARMAEHNISLEQIVQKNAPFVEGELHAIDEGIAVPVILITSKTTEKELRKALQKIEKDGHVKTKPQVIRIERKML
jgi:homoserine dehydrogenase